jgi:hypothetical protein
MSSEHQGRLVINVGTLRQRNAKTTRGPEQCHNVPQLLRALNIDEIPVHKQADVLRVWLRAHPPGHDLRLSLLSNGYGHVVDEAVGRPPHKSPAPIRHSA